MIIGVLVPAGVTLYADHKGYNTFQKIGATVGSTLLMRGIQHGLPALGPSVDRFVAKRLLQLAGGSKVVIKKAAVIGAKTALRATAGTSKIVAKVVARTLIAPAIAIATNPITLSIGAGYAVGAAVGTAVSDELFEGGGDVAAQFYTGQGNYLSGDANDSGYFNVKRNVSTIWNHYF
tara:strand:+ start:241 stop:771 length:531 start_codon:yes stop_codon:yes gene_type:complete